jgi:hypothetical protein
MRSNIRLMLVAVDTLVEHTESIGEHGKELGCGKRTSHPISVAVSETVVKAVLNAEHDNRDNINAICKM